MASSPCPLVLVADDEPKLRKLLRIVLTAGGMSVKEACNGVEALQIAATHSPDLVLLDLGLPDVDGIDLTRRLREWMTAPIVVVSAREGEHDKVAAFEAGANDYLTKPFGHAELLARLRMWLRTGTGVAAGASDGCMDVGPFRVDLDRRLVYLDGRELHLTRTEFKLLATLARNREKVMTHAQLLQAAWGPGCTSRTQYLRVYMGHLRRKLEVDPARPKYLVTEPGVGYRLRVNAG